MWKVTSGRCSRQLVGLMDKMSKMFVPSYGLIHHKHTYLASEGPVRVMTDIGDIKALIKTPQDAEYTLLKTKRKRNYRQIDVTAIYTEYFNGILENTLMPAIHSLGGGIKAEHLRCVRRRVIGDREEYTLYPTIHWCTIKSHLHPQGNPCRYFISLRMDNTFSLDMLCFGCGFDTDIFVGPLPKEGCD